MDYILLNFAEELGRVMKTKKVTVNQLAKYTGVDHSTMYKIVQGRRKPANINVVRSICQCLCLNDAEVKKMKEAYYLTVLGQSEYCSSRLISDLISSLSDKGILPEINAAVVNDSVIQKDDVLNDAKTLQSALISLCKEAGDAGDEQAFLLTSGNLQLSQPLVNMSCKLYPHMHVNQIFVLDDSMQVDDNYRVYNFDCLNALFPLMIRYPEYSARTIYANVNSMNSLNENPGDFFLTKHGVCVFNRNFQHGFITHDKKMISLYYDVFHRIHEKSHQLMRFDVPDDITALNCQLDARYRTETDPSMMYYFNPGICSVLALDEKETVMSNHLAFPEPFKSRFIKMMHEHIKTQQEYLFSMKDKLVQITTVQGIRYFVSKGYINEFHSNMMSPLMIPERIEILKKYKQIIDEGWVTLIDNSLIAEDSLLVFQSSANDLMMQINRSDGMFITGIIKEASIVSQFYRYCDFAMNELKLGHDEALAFIDECIEMLEDFR